MLEHPPQFANGDEKSFARLVNWALDLDSQTLDKRLPSHLSSPRHIRGARLTSAFESKPAGIRCPRLSKEASTILQEIVVWAWPRGRVVNSFATNRMSSAVDGPVLRDFPHNGDNISGHELMAAHNGISEFLAMRGYSDAEIEAVLPA